MRYVRQYITAIWSHWVSRMSGIASIIFIIVALVFRVTEVGQARYWVAAAVLSYVVASFLAWRKDRLNVERLNQIVESLQSLPQVTGHVTVTPTEILQVFKGRTSIAATKLAGAYIGKWITVTGNVRDVSRVGTEQARVSFDQDGNITVFMLFEKSLTDAVSALQKGDSITVRGEISTVDSSYVSLEKCELIKF